MVGHNASGFDKYIVVNSLPKSYTSEKILKTSRRLIKLSFKDGFANENGREILKKLKFVCSKCHIAGSLQDIQKEYNIQPQLIKREIAHDLITLSIYKEHEHLWKFCLIDDVVGPAYAVSKHGNSIQKRTVVSNKNSLTESSLGCVRLGRSFQEDNKTKKQIR